MHFCPVYQRSRWDGLRTLQGRAWPCSHGRCMLAGLGAAADANGGSGPCAACPRSITQAPAVGPGGRAGRSALDKQIGHKHNDAHTAARSPRQPGPVLVCEPPPQGFERQRSRWCDGQDHSWSHNPAQGFPSAHFDDDRVLLSLRVVCWSCPQKCFRMKLVKKPPTTTRWSKPQGPPACGVSLLL